MHQILVSLDSMSAEIAGVLVGLSIGLLHHCHWQCIGTSVGQTTGHYIEKHMGFPFVYLNFHGYASDGSIRALS